MAEGLAQSPGESGSLTVLPAFERLRRAAPRSSSWWGRAWVRTFEETALAHEDLVAGRRLARAGVLGAIGVDDGHATSVLTNPAGETLVVRLMVAVLGDDGWHDFATEVSRASGHAADLIAGQLTPALVEHCDEAGVEVFPGPADVDTACDCGAWAQPCPHALGLMYQLAWLIDADPFVLLRLRGHTRDAVLVEVSGLLDAALGVRVSPADEPGGERDDVAARATRILALADEAPAGHGLADAAVASYDERVSELLDPS